MTVIQVLKCPKCDSDQIRHEVCRTAKRSGCVVEVKCMVCDRFTRHYSNDVIGAEYRVAHDWIVEETKI